VVAVGTVARAVALLAGSEGAGSLAVGGAAEVVFAAAVGDGWLDEGGAVCVLTLPCVGFAVTTGTGVGEATGGQTPRGEGGNE
jgi:hypothetical protein